MKIYFIGIGGIGVSALAKYYLTQKNEVFGSDLVSSEITDDLKNKGAKIFIGPHKTKNLIKNLDLVIYSPAITKENPELKKAKKLKIKCQSYPEALGELTKKYFTIAVCGSHGKSTVAALIGLILVKSKFDPTVILGTKLKDFGDSNCRVGKSQFLVIEADEYKESFLNYWPQIIVLTTIEADHLDYYKNFKNYCFAFKKFISHLPQNGFLIANKDDKNINALLLKTPEKIKWYSLKNKESKKLKKILKIPGNFNVSNALAALSVARILKIPDKISFKTLSHYQGSWRRFDERILKIKNKKLKIIHDYGHHPTQFKVTLEAVKEKYPKKKIFCIFQPHQYQRTYYFFDDFVRVFKEVLLKNLVDQLIITDIYEVAGRENKKIKTTINPEKLVKSVITQNKILKERLFYLSGFKEILNYLIKKIRGGEIIIIMGAGDIYKIWDLLNQKKYLK